MHENVGTAIDRTIAFEEEGIRAYQAAAKESAAPNVRSLLLSILNQKTKRCSRLKQFRSTFPGEGESVECGRGLSGTAWNSSSDQFAILDAVVLEERTLQERYSTLADALRFNEDGSALLLALSEEARKHASWAQDHLDLLTLA